MPRNKFLFLQTCAAGIFSDDITVADSGGGDFGACAGLAVTVFGGTLHGNEEEELCGAGAQKS